MKPVVLLGEAMGANEVRTGTPFVGASGIELLRMLSEAGLISLTAEDHSFISRFWSGGGPQLIDMVWRMHPEVYRSNVFALHPPGNDIASLCGPRTDAVPGYPALLKAKYLRAEFSPHLERLADELLRLDPNLIICLGNTPLWALCGSTGISKLRGTTRLSTHCASGFKVLATYHPAAVLRQWELRPTVVADLMKAARERDHPEIRRPQREIWIEPTLADLQTFYNQHIVGCRWLSVDIENPGGPISEVGLGHAKAAIVIPFVDARKKGKSYWETTADEVSAVNFIRGVLEDRQIKKVMQNGLHDVSAIFRYWGIRTYGFEHDDMLLHHSLQPESLKGLAFLGSMYTDEGAWKQMRKFTSLKRDD